MVMGSFRKFAVGEIGCGLIDYDRVHRAQPFVVLREATAEEWVDHVVANGIPETTARRELSGPQRILFYEISVD